jgi:hypothetical protein
MRVCVFAASSSRIDSRYSEAASELGKLLAQAGMEVVYGGGGIGLMGKLADAVLGEGGRITGIIPGFMEAEGWGHGGITGKVVTHDMGERKKTMFLMSDAVVALPGGIGTSEELTEAITLKQLGLFRGPVVILNTLGYYRHFIEFLEHMISESFLRVEHKSLWEVVDTPADVIAAIRDYKGWVEDPRSIAKIY